MGLKCCLVPQMAELVWYRLASKYVCILIGFTIGTISKGSTKGAIGNTIGANGTDRWLPIMQTAYIVGNIANAGKGT